MTRRLHFAFFVALIAMGAVPLRGAAPGSVSGVVRNSAGVPQIGAVVQLLRPDLNVVAIVYTDDKGRFSIPAVLPGRYALKAMGSSFLPSLREGVRVRRGTVVNLTLNTLYEVMQWFPTQPRAANAQKDDWAWTLRSAANRPLLRWLEDGPLVVVSDGSGARPKLKARLIATGEQGTFGESGERITASVENTPSDSRELLARVDFDPHTDAGMESMLGFRQELGFAGSVQSLAAIAIHPEIETQGAEGVDELAMRSWENINLGDTLQAEVGAEQVLARFDQNSPNTVVAALPFASVGLRAGNDSVIRYRMSTSVPARSGADESEAAYYLPQLAARNGALTLERGMHQELGWERQTDSSAVAVMVFADSIRNPVIEATSHMVAGGSSFNSGPSSGNVLFDPASGILHTAGPNYSSAGFVATVERSLPHGQRLRLSYANGDALAMPVVSHPLPLAEVFAAGRPRRVQTYTLSLSGTLEGTGTKWRASYRWQPEDTVTPVAPFSVESIEPYLNLHLRQPICVRHEGGSSIEALLDVRNMLAEGYRPYVLSDGSLLVFAQNQRAIRAGLAFTF
ncbi:MAG: carboxypeptidase-like regulatory domain-containing protein [Terracidiphilus sp.]